MNKNTQIAIVIIFGLGLLTFFIKPKNNNTEATGKNQIVTQSSSTQPSQPIGPAEKIEVVHFHGTQQCVSCITVGEYALKTITEKFPKELESGKIVFKDINGELKENEIIVMKYKARGSSLFVNAIVEGKDNIKEDVTVWRLVNDEEEFVSYFEKKLNGLLGR